MTAQTLAPQLGDQMLEELAAHGMTDADHDGHPLADGGLRIPVDGSVVLVEASGDTIAVEVAPEGGSLGDGIAAPGSPFTDARAAAVTVARLAHASLTGTRRSTDGTATPEQELYFEHVGDRLP